MRNRAASILSSALVALLFALLWGCGSDSGNPTKPDPDPDPDPDPSLSHEWTPGLLGLPPADSAVLDSAAARYRVLRLAGDAGAARTTLVSALNAGWPGVDAAGITGDGTTIQIVFTDTVTALIVTDEMFQTGGGEQAASFFRDSPALSDLRRPGSASSGCDPAIGPLTNAGCAGAVVPTNHQIHIINPAAATVPRTKEVTTQIRDDLLERGWNESDILIQEPASANDPSFTPEVLFSSSELPVGASFGDIKVYAGTFAAMASTALGAEAFTLGETLYFGTGRFDDGNPPLVNSELHHVSPERWSEYEGWLKEGKMVHGKAWSASTQSMVDQLFIREDLLAEEIALGENATVHFLTPRSGRKSNLEGMVKTGGAASAMGWDGPVDPQEAATSMVQLIDNMVGRAEGSRPQTEAVSLLHDQGMATYTHAGETSTLIVETASDAPLFLPAQIGFDAPFDCLESGTVYYDVDVTYADCPGMNQSFDFFPGGEHSITGLFPFGAEISYQAKDADGKVLGAGIYDLDLTGGPNDLDLCPCYGKLDAEFPDFSAIPGIDAGATLIGDFLYSDPNIPDRSWSMPVAEIGDIPGFESIPGEAKVAFRVEDGQGDVLGYAKLGEELDLRCDANQSMDLCFGWMEFTPGRIWSETSSMVISGTSNATWVTPSPVTLTPGGEVDMMGLGVGENVHITAEARSATGEVLDVVEFDQVIECGPNEVVLNFNTYGLILHSDKARAPASGFAGAVLVGKVRKWQDSDTDEPTGDSLPGVDVFFSTDLGRFQVTPGTYSPTVVKATDEDGYVWVYMTSLEEGTATINAFVEDPSLEAEPVTVEFEKPIKMVVDDTEEDYDGYILPDSTQSIKQYCVIFQKWTDGSLSHEDPDLEPVAHSYVYPGHHLVGEEVKFVWIPGTGCPAQNYGYTGPYISGAYLHYHYGEDYNNQVTKFMIGEKNPLTQTVEFTTTLVDPSAPPPSPFDLTAPERMVLNGFRERPLGRFRDLRK